MAIISFSKDTVIDYIPEYGDNRKSESPCVIGIKFIPFGETVELERIRAARMRGVEPEKALDINQSLQKERFQKHIDFVRGYSVNGVAVMDAGEFYETAPAELVAEILLAMQDAFRLSKGQAKDFKQASA